jgi:hypothetical protein
MCGLVWFGLVLGWVEYRLDVISWILDGCISSVSLVLGGSVNRKISSGVKTEWASDV